MDKDKLKHSKLKHLTIKLGYIEGINYYNKHKPGWCDYVTYCLIPSIRLYEVGFNDNRPFISISLDNRIEDVLYTIKKVIKKEHPFSHKFCTPVKTCL